MSSSQVLQAVSLGTSHPLALHHCCFVAQHHHGLDLPAGSIGPDLSVSPLLSSCVLEPCESRCLIPAPLVLTFTSCQCWV